MIRVVQPHGDHLGWEDRDQGADPLARGRRAVKGRRAEDIAAQPEQFAVHNLGVENFRALLKSTNGCHRDAPA